MVQVVNEVQEVRAAQVVQGVQVVQVVNMVLVVRIAWVVRLVLVIKFVNAYGLHGKVMQYSALAKFAMKVIGRVAGIDGTMVIANFLAQRTRNFVYFLVNLALFGLILTGLNDATADQK